MEKNYNGLEEKIRNIEKRLISIISTPCKPEMTRSDQLKLNHNLSLINNLVSLEMVSSTTPHSLANILRRIIRLQRATRAWTEGRPFGQPVNAGGSSPCSYIESCVTDDKSENCFNREEFEETGFNVYKNPEYVDEDDDDDDDNTKRVEDLEEVQELEGVNDDLGIGVGRVDHQIDGNRDEEEEQNKGSRNCSYRYKICFWFMILVTGLMSIMVHFSEIPSHCATVTLLTPT